MYHSDSNSTEALKQLLLQLPRKNNNINNTSAKDKDYNNNSGHPLLFSTIFQLVIPAKILFISVQMQKNIITSN